MRLGRGAMMTRRTRFLLIAALVVISFLTAYFALRAFEHGRQVRVRPDEPIQPWMTIPYVAHAYHVPPVVVQEALGLPPDPPDRRPLREIAAAQGRSSDAAIVDITAAIALARPPRGPASGTPSRPATPVVGP